MNPNMPYGQQMPIQHQRRHDAPYGQTPPHMRPHPGYQQYYNQPMAPMMAHYPQQYQQQWYPYQPQMPQYHNPRPQYYQAPQHVPPQLSQNHGPLIVSSQPHALPTPRYFPSQPNSIPSQPPSTSSVTSPMVDATPPSRSMSTTSAVDMKKDQTRPVTPGTPQSQALRSQSVEPEAPSEPFFPPVPWLSDDSEPFPPRAPRRRRLPRSALINEPVVFPLIEEENPATVDSVEIDENQVHAETLVKEHVAPSPTQTPTPLPSDATSDNPSTQPTTPSSAVPTMMEKSPHTPTQARPARTGVQVMPVLPVLPHSPSTRREHRDSTTSANSKLDDIVVQPVSAMEPTVSQQQPEGNQESTSDAGIKITSTVPKSWADLVRSKGGVAGLAPAAASANANGSSINRADNLGEVLSEININESSSKITFLQPRGLVNTGNMCYMNSVLQILVFCIPFYDFLDKIAKRATHAFKSDTPLIDAILLFMTEYAPIDTADSVEKLRLRLKPEDFERYGDPFIPEYVYTAINKLPRFRDMRRGHQQDAQEFLGFLLEELHEECALAMQRSGTSTSSGVSTPVGGASNLSEPMDNDSGWMEVGHKQRSAVTRSSGAIVTESPVTSIFGGKLRSELKVSGNKMSVTLEPYQPLQLDIGSPQINNIIDALKGLTKPESMQGDFQSARGAKATAIKQVFIETLPPVLILHLKRFHYDATTKRAEKIWKKIGYPLELEIPKEVFPPSTRNRYAAHGGVPKYKLTGVIYHHGKNANGGHYTVDIRRQDGQEWIRLDDTLIRRIRSQDVAEGGSEEDPKVLAAALERHKQGQIAANRFGQIDADDEERGESSEKVWNQVNGHSRSKSTFNNVINGSSTPAKDSSGLQTPSQKFSVKDNKVAYLLFYQRIDA